MYDFLSGYRSEVIKALSAIDLYSVGCVLEALLATRSRGSTVFVVGNGGSAATASHIATDFMLGSGLSNPPLRVISLADNMASITATGNDLDFKQIFSRQLSKLANPEDVLLAVSASGNSPNIVECVAAAKDLGLLTVGFTGFDGGELARRVDLLVHVPTRVGAYGTVEDAHLMVNHMITEQLQRIAAEEAHP